MFKKGRAIADTAFLTPFYLIGALSVSDANHDVHRRDCGSLGLHNNHGIHRNIWDLHNNPSRHTRQDQAHRLQVVHNNRLPVEADKRNNK